MTGKVRPGICTGAILRTPLNDPAAIQPVAWGYRNPNAIRFAPDDHPLAGKLFDGENGEDERGARPVESPPDRFSIAEQNPDGTPSYHGWPDRFGFLPSDLREFNPTGGPLDDLCSFSNLSPADCTAIIQKEDVPIRDVLAGPPEPITAPIGLEAADSSITSIDFAPDSFVGGPVQEGAALYSLGGDLGFSAANATPPAPEVGHEVKLINFSQNGPLTLSFENFARNKGGGQAFTSGAAGINRPDMVRFGPDGCAYVADFGAVRAPGVSDPDEAVQSSADLPFAMIPATGVIWKICPAH